MEFYMNSTMSPVDNMTNASMVGLVAPRFTNVTFVKIGVLSLMFLVSLSANSAVLVCVGCRRRRRQLGSRRDGGGATCTGGQFSASCRRLSQVLFGGLAETFSTPRPKVSRRPSRNFFCGLFEACLLGVPVDSIWAAQPGLSRRFSRGLYGGLADESPVHEGSAAQASTSSTGGQFSKSSIDLLIGNLAASDLIRPHSTSSNQQSQAVAVYTTKLDRKATDNCP